jgi:hypothetical protein
MSIPAYPDTRYPFNPSLSDIADSNVYTYLFEPGWSDSDHALFVAEAKVRDTESAADKITRRARWLALYINANGNWK